MASEKYKIRVLEKLIDGRKLSGPETRALKAWIRENSPAPAGVLSRALEANESGQLPREDDLRVLVKWVEVKKENLG